MSALTIADLEKAPTWLLTVTWAGQVYRWCSHPDGLTVTLPDGATAYHEPGYDPPDVSQQGSGPATAPDEMSIPVEVYFPVNVASLESLGHSLDSATAEVALLPDGGTWADRLVYLEGDVVEPVYGGQDEPVSFSVEAYPWDDGALWPPSGWVIDETTWPQAAGFEIPDDYENAIYPTIIGTPGWVTRSPSATTSGSPGLVVSYETATSFAHKLLIAGHRVGAASVIVFYDGGNITGTVTHEEDGRDQTCAVIDISGEASAVKQSSWYWIGWNVADGGMLLDTGDGPLELAGDICEWMLRQGTRRVDQGRWRAARAHLNRYRLAGYIADEPVQPWQWLEENILPLLPVSVHQGPGGLYPLVWMHTATDADVVASLTEGREITRAGPVEVEPLDDVVNEVRIRHSKRGRTGDWRGMTVVRGNAGTNEHDSYLGRISAARYGQRALQLDSEWIYGDDVAARIGGDIIAAKWAPGRSIPYGAGSEEAWLTVGKVVSLTDADLSITGQVAQVMGVEWESEEAVSLRLRVTAQPTRDRRVS